MKQSSKSGGKQNPKHPKIEASESERILIKIKQKLKPMQQLWGKTHKHNNEKRLKLMIEDKKRNPMPNITAVTTSKAYENRRKKTSPRQF